MSAPNYSFNFVSGVLNVTQAVLNVWANDANRTYGAANPPFSIRCTGFVNGDTTNVLGGAAGLTTTATASSPVAFYTITIAPGTLSATNYTFNLINGTMSVTPAVLTVTANNKSRNYGAANPVFIRGYRRLFERRQPKRRQRRPSLTTSATTGSPAGVDTITAAQGTLSAANYTFNPVNGTLTVRQVTLTMTANDTNRIGGGQPGVHGELHRFCQWRHGGGRKRGPSLTTSATTSSPAGGYTITNTLGTLSATNYTFSLVNGTLTVLPGSSFAILSLGVNNQVVTVTWSSVSNTVYGLQSSTNLAGTNWVSLLPNVTATGSTASQTNAIGGAPQKFYRVTVISGP